MIRVRFVLLALVVALLATACRIEATVDIDIAEDGSGLVTVTFVADKEAVELSPDLPDALRLDDLTAAGWAVTGPDPITAGGITASASKPFASAGQLPVVLAEIVGDGVLFRDVELTQTRGPGFGLTDLLTLCFGGDCGSFARTTYELTGTIDPTPDVAAFGDEQLAQALANQALGRSVAEIEREGGALEDSLGLVLKVSLPDDIETATGERDGNTATWTFSYGEQPLELSAIGTTESSVPRVWAFVAVGTLVLLLLVLLLRIVRWVVRILRTPKGRRRRDARRRQQRAASREAEASRPRRRLMRLLVVDA
ncbi:MAG: hypothetical protein ACE5GB_06255, partial [Acidimicrobiales bacterium]